MILPRKRFVIHAVWTFLASPIIYFVVINQDFSTTKLTPLESGALDLLSAIFFAPGSEISGWLVRIFGISGWDGLTVFFLTEVFCNWAVLLICVVTIEFFINRKRRQA